MISRNPTVFLKIGNVGLKIKIFGNEKIKNHLKTNKQNILLKKDTADDAMKNQDYQIEELKYFQEV